MDTSDHKTSDSQAYETKNDISKEARAKLSALLNQHLADALDLQLQLKHAHWNVKGPSFIALHEFFDSIVEGVQEYADTIAERVVQLGGIAHGTARTVAAHSRLAEYPPKLADGLAYVDAVACALAAFGREVRKSINTADQLNDADTADIFTEISRGIDKWLWLVEAHSQAAQ